MNRRDWEKKELPLDFDLKNYVFVYDNEDNIYSVLRYKWRIIRIGKQVLNSLITTDFCLSLDTSRSVTRDLEATKLSLDFLANLTEGLVLGDARKELGSFYKFFEFEQIGNYSECIIEEYNFSGQVGEDSFKQLTNMTLDLANSLSKLKSTAETNQFISVMRSSKIWATLVTNYLSESPISLFALMEDDSVLAYIILDDSDSVIEFGEDSNRKSDISSFVLSFFVSHNVRKIKVDLANSLFQHLRFCDLQVKFRRLEVKGMIARVNPNKKNIQGFCDLCSDMEQLGHAEKYTWLPHGILNHSSNLSSLDWI